MNIATRKGRKGFTLVELLVVIAIIVALAALATPQIFKALKRAALAEALNNARQVKFALDGFATDFDGQFPNDDTGEQVVEGGTGQASSNDYFRQLFMSGETQSETIFWVKNSPVASKSSPDDKVAEGGKPQQQLILQAGDCHWAYMT
ncbi:MAG: prepilin-type N-terminal cleavage/methylation domain-containing protein, partial [Roseibacillus sp.]